MSTSSIAVKPNDLETIFRCVREFYKAQAPGLIVLHDEPHRYYLGTTKVRANDGYRLWFGGVEIKKRYVSAHIMPVYVYPALLTEITPGLRKRMQGKACFNFSRFDEALFAELAALIASGAAALTQNPE